MSDAILVGILTAVVALVGVAIQNAFSLRREDRQRQWAIEDLHSVRKREVIERRCQQVDKIVEIMMENFRTVYDACIQLVHADTNQKILDLEQQHVVSAIEINRRFASHAHVIHRLGDDVLLTHWKTAMGLLSFDY